MTNRLLLVDVDDTILNFDTAFEQWMTGRGVHPRIPLVDAKNVEDAYGVTEEETISLIREFYRTPSFGQLEPLNCAREILPALYRDGYRFVAITACEDIPEVAVARRKNLRDAFGFDFEDVHITGLHQGKLAFLERYEPTLWVDDHPYHVTSGAQAGHNTMLIDRKRNAYFAHDNVRRVKDWHEITNYL